MRVSKNKTVSELSRRPKKKKVAAIFGLSFFSARDPFLNIRMVDSLKAKGW